MDGKGNTSSPQIHRRGFHRHKAQYYVERDEEDLDHQDWSERLEDALEQAHQEFDDLDEIYFSQRDAPVEEDRSEEASYWQDDDWHGYGVYDDGWYEDNGDEPWCDVTEAYQQDVADFESNMDACAAAMLNSASAQRTGAEAKKLVADMKTSREYLPIVGIAARPMSDTQATRAPPKKGGKSKKGTSKRDKGKGKGKNTKGKTGKYGGNIARPLGGTR